MMRMERKTMLRKWIGFRVFWRKFKPLDGMSLKKLHPACLA
ncbi:hypothetical protein Gohar_026188 [Gossypium harknessii]|uniref:Uncharacterized protein n=1 Tax=Gossypium harknessii TaxID=34285 RepID=A0A7J9HQT9_9ROSI|nr:hypothetical protein [Gossypium harknessii]